MKFKVFLDSTVFIYSFERPDSNSKKIIELLNKNKVIGVASTRVVKEVTKYFENFYSLELSRKFRKYIISSSVVIPEDLVKDFMHELKGKIKEKDLEQLAVVRKYHIKYLISYDRDFRNIDEYKTPREFIRILGLNAAESEY